MPLQKIVFKPGVNRENTRYTNEGGWYESNLVRFRQGTPEKIGGWVRTSSATFLGICRSLWQWVTLAGIKYTGVGTNLKFYIESGGVYNDITPIAHTNVLAGPFAATNGSTTLTVTHVAHGALTGDFVTYSGAVSLGGVITAAVLNIEYQITRIASANTYEVTMAIAANASDIGNGGATVTAAYQIPVGPATQVVTGGWGAGAWGGGTWGGTTGNLDILRLWSQMNFGENLLICPRYGGVYYWTAVGGLTARAVNITTLGGASDCPTTVQFLTVSDVSRFTLAFGVNPAGSAVLDPMLVRWSDQESVTQWTPASTNQAGFLRLSHGSTIMGILQTRQEILVWTDAALYSMQFVGYPTVWSFQLIADNISIISPNAMALASGTVYWMGVDKFYKYDGRVATQTCDLRQFIYDDINLTEAFQSFGSTSEGFNEVWWWYCPAGSKVASRYVVFNYEENVWYYGTMARTAWLDSGISNYPLAATYSNNLCSQEFGLDDLESGSPVALPAYILSSEFDINDGHAFGFVWRILPDMSFNGSTATAPAVVMTLYPLDNSGSGYSSPASVAGSNYASVTRTVSVPIEQFTGQINVRVRGRQMAMKIDSNQLGCQWQLGSPRIDIRADGRGS